MKIALFIEDGREQIVLTPEGKTERTLLEKLSNGDRRVSIYRGDFYACQGGWTRQREGESSAIIVLEPQDTDA